MLAPPIESAATLFFGNSDILRSFLYLCKYERSRSFQKPDVMKNSFSRVKFTDYIAEFMSQIFFQSMFYDLFQIALLKYLMFLL